MAVGGKKSPSGWGKLHKGRSSAQSISSPCLHGHVNAGDVFGFGALPCASSASGAEGSQCRCREKERWNSGGKSAPTPPEAPPARCRHRENHPRAASRQSRAPSLCRSTPSPACWGFSISTTSPGILPTPRHDVPTLRGWRYPRSCTHSPEATPMATPGRVGLTGLGQKNISVLFPQAQPCPWLGRPVPRVRQPGRALSSPKTTAAAYAKHITGAKTSRSRVFYS